MRILWATVVLGLLAPAALAQGNDGGIRFDVMPVGCEIHVKYGNGEVRVETYAGKKGKTFLTRSFSAGKQVSTTTYDAKGRMIRKDWAGGKWETFRPFSCFSIPGECRYKYRNGDGADKEYVGKVVKRGKGYVSSGGFKREPPFNDTVLTLGPFNNSASFREGDTTFKVIEYRNCGVGS
jgi:YD repeat-containing protein